ncbi:MAG: mechanosensitive ion channel family protein [Clostridiales bacterium]|nr:mechanosensitive ion channel family protein [Clostridiales bacterium]
MNRLFLADVAKELSDVTDELKNSDVSSVTPNQVDRLLSALSSAGMKLLKCILIALIVYFVGKKLIKWILKIMDLTLDRSGVDSGVVRFLHSLVKITLNVVLCFIVAGILGLETGSLVAVIGSAGLAVGLSLQGSLANLAGGVLILITKPFHIGDYIVVGDKEGTVTTIDIFYTRILTVDNRLIVIPNGTLSNSTILNVSNEAYRRVDITVSIGYGSRIDKARQILLEIAGRNPLALKDEEHMPEVMVSSLGESSVDLLYKVWTKQEDYWMTRSILLEEIKARFDDEEIEIPFRQLDVNLNSCEKK